jgi:hypothetical protein
VLAWKAQIGEAILKGFFSYAAVLVGLVSASGLQASNLADPCLSQSLQQYQSLDGAQCSVGILNFSDFTFSSSGSGGATLLTAADILVTPSTNGDLGGGFSLSAISPGAFAVAEGQTATYVIDWFFLIDPGPRSAGAELGMDPPFGDVTITQSYCVDSFFGTGANGGVDCVGRAASMAPQTLTVTTIPPHLDDSIIFNPAALNFASVMTTITINGTAGPSGFDSTTGTAVVVDSSTPEPVTSVLALGGLLVTLGVIRKRSV